MQDKATDKFYLRFGCCLSQFCNTHCLEEYKKSLKICCFCQKDISKSSDSYRAVKGVRGAYKDFCSKTCSDSYNKMGFKKIVVPPGTICCVCKSEKNIEVEFEMSDKMHYFCGDPCFVAFRFVNNIISGKLNY